MLIAVLYLPLNRSVETVRSLHDEVRVKSASASSLLSAVSALCKSSTRNAHALGLSLGHVIVREYHVEVV